MNQTMVFLIREVLVSPELRGFQANIMDSGNEGILLIATTMVVLVFFGVGVVALMLVYRKRRLRHQEEVRQMNEQFARELLQSQLEIQQQTMAHIGREIHDHVGHQLTLASLYSHQLQPADEAPSELAVELGQIIDTTLNDLRSLSADLTSGQVSPHTTLNAWLEEECEKLGRAHFLAIDWADGAEPYVGSIEANTFVLRIFQEFAQNSLKHAHASCLKVRLVAVPDAVQLTAEDDGIGFSRQAPTKGAGIGLKNMEQRAQMIGADFSLDSVPGQGTKLTLTLPLQLKHPILHGVSRSNRG